jgi:NAD(P)-dependent dehydrogenase (short-subunit alcohol dehydrogenase family)
MATALILGASRGIGLEFCKQYIEEGWRVYATYRTEDDRVKLRDLGAQTLKLNVLDINDVSGIAWQLDGEQIDVAIMNAGVYGPRTSNLQQPPSVEDFDNVMRTNVLAAMRIIPIVAPLLSSTRGTLAFVSSRMGSIAEAGGSYGMLYRTSKAAVNMLAKLAHTDYSPLGVRVISLHPGWVRTDMGGPNADVEASVSVAGLRRVVSDGNAFPSGCFYDYRGQSLAW